MFMFEALLLFNCFIPKFIHSTPESISFPKLIKVGGRGFPDRLIFPWARWGWGPGQIPELFGRRRIFLKNHQK